MNAAQPLQLARWVRAGAPAVDGPLFMRDDGSLPNRLTMTSLVLEKSGIARARLRLSAGARQVLLGDAALEEPGIVGAAVREFGAARVGAWLTARRAHVSWSLDSVSNGDFKCVVPSNPQARWDVVRSDGEPAGVDVERCIERVLVQGARTVLVGIDLQDDRDLDLCAGLVERFGSHLWLTPLHDLSADLTPWVEWGQVRQLVLPDRPGSAAMARQLMDRFGRAAPVAEAA
jgi:hypothetical protein